jgi:nucleoside-diphosphate-sugar epimerase
MRAVVTGGAGFIGSHLVETLAARGDEVVCVERAGAGRGWLEGHSVDFRPIGLRHAARLAAALEGADVVFHLAALTEARSAGDFYAVNSDGTRRLLQAASQWGSAAPRVVLLSSLAALGPCRQGEILSPDSIPCPLSHYGQSKLIAEAMVHAYSDRVPATILRLPPVYGPRERAVLKLFRMVRHGIALTVGRWEREISMLYVRDAVAGLIAAAEAPRAVGRTYCLAHPERVTWAAFARAAGRAVGRDPVLISVPVPLARLVAVAAETAASLRRTAAILNRERLRELIQQSWVCDPSRAMIETGFRPQFAVERGTLETAAWYREARWL